MDLVIDHLQMHKGFSTRGDLWPHEPTSACGSFSRKQHSWGEG